MKYNPISRKIPRLLIVKYASTILKIAYFKLLSSKCSARLVTSFACNRIERDKDNVFIFVKIFKRNCWVPDVSDG